MLFTDSARRTKKLQSMCCEGPARTRFLVLDVGKSTTHSYIKKSLSKAIILIKKGNLERGV